jgi:lantibiotic biosynthesis protein
MKLKAPTWFLSRSPLLPIETVFPETLPKIQAELLDLIRNIRRADSVMSARANAQSLLCALMVANSLPPHFYSRLNQNHKMSWTELHPSVAATLTRFILRAAGRPTPYGLFADISLGFIKPEQLLEVGQPALETTFHASGILLEKIRSHLERSLLQTGDLRVRLNSSVSIFNGHAKAMLTPQEDRNAGTFLKISSTVIAKTLKEIAADYIRASDFSERLTRCLPNRADVDLDTETLLATGLLQSDLHPPLSAVDGLCWFMARLEQSYPDFSAAEMTRLSVMDRQIRALTECCTQSSGIDLGRLSEGLASIHEESSSLPVPVETKLQHSVTSPVQLIARRPRNLALNRRTADIIAHTSQSLIERTLHVSPLYEDLVSLFQMRFDEGPVPLVHLAEFANEYRSHLAARSAERRPFDVALTDFLRSEAARKRSPTDGIDLTRFEGWQPPNERLAGLFALASIRGAGVGGPLDIYLKSVSGFNGCELLTRYAGHAGALADLLKELAAQQPVERDLVYAEVPFCPSLRLRDVRTRPQLWPHFISLTGNEGEFGGKEIPASDLHVIRDRERLRLFSLTLGRQVVPQFSTAHDYLHEGNPALYRTLGILANRLLFGFQWPREFKTSDRLPRVHLNGTWLAPETWRLSADSIKRIQNAPWTRKAKVLNDILDGLGVPTEFEIGTRDQLLRCSKSSKDSMLAACSVARVRELRVQESFSAGHRGLIADTTSGDTWLAECIFPMSAVKPADMASSAPYKIEAAKRGLDLSSDAGRWQYLRFYQSVNDSSSLLSSIVRRLEPLRSQSHVSRWFFVRYRDPLYHLRVRVLPSSDESASRITHELEALAHDAVRRGTVWRWSSDTYEPEFLRYGGQVSYALCERIFEIDSYFSIKTNQIISADQASGSLRGARLYTMACSARAIFGAMFGSEAIEILRAVKEGYLDSTEIRSSWPRTAGELWETDFLSGRLLINTRDEPNAFQRITDAASRFELLARNTFQELADSLRHDGAGSIVVREIAGSLYHMSCNRFLPVWNRRDEFIGLEIASRTLRSKQRRPSDPKGFWDT